MPSVQPVFQKHKINKRGEAPISIRVINNRKSSYKSTGIRLNPIHWDEAKQRVKKSYKNSVQVNALLFQQVAEAQQSLNNLRLNEGSFSSNQVFDALKNKRVGIIEYSAMVFERSQNRYSVGTMKRYKAAISKVGQYLNSEDLALDKITVSWLKKYEAYLHNVLLNDVNTVSSNLKVLRTILSEATAEGLIDHSKNPFTGKRFKIKSKQTKITYLTDDEISMFEEVQLPEGSRLDEHRNLYLFACYTAGLRISDLLKLNWSSFDGDILRIVTSKSDEPIGIPLTKKAKAILECFPSSKSRKGLVFGLIPDSVNLSDPEELHKAISRVTSMVNKNLKIISMRAGIGKKLHFHTSRHTFATKALRAGIPIVHVSKLLGHRNIKTTMIYLKIENSDLQKSMLKFDESC